MGDVATINPRAGYKLETQPGHIRSQARDRVLPRLMFQRSDTISCNLQAPSDFVANANSEAADKPRVGGRFEEGEPKISAPRREIQVQRHSCI